MFLVVSFFGAVGIVLTLLTIGLILLRHKPEMIFGKYPRRGIFYRLKYVIALLVLKRLRHKIFTKREQKFNAQEYLTELDRPQQLTSDPKSYDFVSFTGANVEGYKLMVNLERRRCGLLKSCVYLWVPEHGLLCSPNLPDTLYFTTDGKEGINEFKGNDCHIFPEECMRRWRIRYDGKLRNVKSTELVAVKFDLQFSSTLAHFNYNKDLSASVIADAIAHEAWNDQLYGLLKNVDCVLDKRTHYEQHGLLKGELCVGNQQSAMEMKGFRDHSFGTERCLSTINRYVYFALFLNDGTSIVVGNLSQPSFFLSSLKVGYICTTQGDYQPITKCNFELYSYGEKGKPPQHQNFIVDTASQRYFVQIKVENEALRFNGGNWESKVFNQFVICTVNGIKGHGITEYLYRNASGRPEEVCSKDPEWYQRVRKFERSLSNGENVNGSKELFF